jgi:hypothetical protein
MPDNHIVLLVIVGVYVLLGITLFTLTFRAKDASNRAERFANSLGLAIPDELRRLTGRRLARRRRTSIAGAVLATLAMLPFLRLEATSDDSIVSTPALLLLSASFIGLAVGTAIGAFQWPALHDPNAVRYARAGAVGLGDYIAPLERTGAWIVVGLAAVMTFIAADLTATGTAAVAMLPPESFGGVLVGLAVLALGFFEVVGRRIVGRAQPTGSEIALVWDDALRSSDVRSLSAAPLTLGLYGVIVRAFDLLLSFRDTSDPTIALIIVNLGTWLAVTTLAFVGIYAIVSHPARYFLRRLWPELADPELPTTAPISSGDADNPGSSRETPSP